MKSPTFTRTHPPPPGFTLVELLITITIIVVLAALSLAGFSRMRMAAYQITSTRNISQLQTANASYAADHNGKYVPWMVTNDKSEGQVGATYWANNYEFLRNFRGEPKLNHEGEAPLSMLDPVTVKAKKDSYMVLYASYGYNIVHMPDMGTGAWPGKNSNGSFRVCQVTNPSRTACFITGTDLRVNPEKPVIWKDKSKQVEGKTGDGKMAFRYGNKTKALVVFYDGHVGTVTIPDIEKIYQNGAGENPFWRADAP